MPKVIIIDNYDSFTYNLVHLVNEIIDDEVMVVKNDKFDIEDIMPFSHIILSPGPGIPDEAGQLKEVVQRFKSTKKIFGVCLGLQAIGEVYGGNLLNLSNVYHGMKMRMNIIDVNDPILKGVSTQFDAGRYHSWVIDRMSFPEDLIISSIDDEGQIMSFYHKYEKVYGVQFHPESIMTPDGKAMMNNFLSIE